MLHAFGFFLFLFVLARFKHAFGLVLTYLGTILVALGPLGLGSCGLGTRSLAGLKLWAFLHALFVLLGWYGTIPCTFLELMVLSHIHACHSSSVFKSRIFVLWSLSQLACMFALHFRGFHTIIFVLMATVWAWLRSTLLVYVHWVCYVYFIEYAILFFACSMPSYIALCMPRGFLHCVCQVISPCIEYACP